MKSLLNLRGYLDYKHAPVPLPLPLHLHLHLPLHLPLPLPLHLPLPNIWPLNIIPYLTFHPSHLIIPAILIVQVCLSLILTVPR